jgi:FkbM family methyltransferase
MGMAYRVKRKTIKYLETILIACAKPWFFYRKQLPAGVDLIGDLKNKFPALEINTIFDIGANTGQTTRTYVHGFPSAKIYSFEPVSETFDSLKCNSSGFSNVICEKIAFSNKMGEQEIALFSSEFSSLNSLNQALMNDEPDAKKEKITLMTIDAYASEKNIKTIDLLKIDTEGHEIPVLDGAGKLLAENRIKLIYCEVGFSGKNKRNTYLSTMVDYMQGKGFVFYAMYDISHIQLFRETHYGNVLFINRTLLPKH